MTTPDAAVAGIPNRRRRILSVAVVIFVGLGAAWYAYYRLVGQYRVSTDDAYVHGDRVQVSPQISGTVTAIYVHDTDFVTRGQVLVVLDPADARLALDKAEAALAAQVRDVRQAYARVDALEATLQVDRAQLTQAQDDLARQHSLRRRGLNSQEKFQHAQTTAQVAEARLTLDRAQLAGARAAVSGTTLADNPAVRQAATAVRSAYLTLRRTRILAPVSGYVANRGVQLGQQVNASTVLMDLVPLDRVWVDANFKESQLRHVRGGQPATVQADFYGNSVTYHGTVVGFSPGTGAAFSLLPAQNATGNWIKVVQRLPVRIDLPAQELKAHPLRLGLSMNVTIQTGHAQASPAQGRRPAAPSPGVSKLYADQLAGAQALVARIIAANTGKATIADGGH